MFRIQSSLNLGQWTLYTFRMANSIIFVLWRGGIGGWSLASRSGASTPVPGPPCQRGRPVFRSLSLNIFNFMILPHKCTAIYASRNLVLLSHMHFSLFMRRIHNCGINTEKNILIVFIQVETWRINSGYFPGAKLLYHSYRYLLYCSFINVLYTCTEHKLISSLHTETKSYLNKSQDYGLVNLFYFWSV